MNSNKADMHYLRRTLTNPKPIDECILTPFGMALFSQLNGTLKPTLEQDLYDILPFLGEVLSFHSNMYADYTASTALLREQRFYEWVFYFERVMENVWDESKIPEEYNSKDMIFNSFRKLDTLAKQNKYVADNQQKLNALIADLLLKGFREDIVDIFIPNISDWMEYQDMHVIRESPYIFRKKVDDGYLFINSYDRLQLLSDQPELTPLMWVQLHSRDTIYIMQYENTSEKRHDYKYVYRSWVGSFDPFN